MRKLLTLCALFVLIFASLGAFATREASQTPRPINLMLSTLPAGKDPQRYKGYVEPKYKEFVQSSLYLTMRDGVKIAIDVVLPKNLPVGERIPAVMNMTRYWRVHEGRVPMLGGVSVTSVGGDSVSKPLPFFVAHGY